MRLVETWPVTVLVQFVPVIVGSVPPQTPALRALMILGLAKPMDTWYPAGPNSWKKPGSPTRRNESCAFSTSSVLVCSHSSPLAIRSADGVAKTPYLPGYKLATIAWPANGDRVVPSDSYFGQVTIMPVMPVGLTAPGVGPPVSIPVRARAETGHASWCVAGSIVPAKLFDNGMLRSEEHTSELQSRSDLVCRLLLEKK